MIWIIYNLIFGLAFTLLLPRFLLHMRRRGGYWEDFWERIGRYDPEKRALLAEGGRFWVHGVSVGEVFVALELIKAVRARDPQARFILSTTTSTGHRLACQRADERDVVIYFPVDCPLLMGRLLKLFKPRALALIETEIWPNLIRIAARRAIPVYIINGRMSDSSFRGYKFLRLFTRRLLPLFSRIFVQSEADRERYRLLGAPPERISVVGTAKYETAGVSEDEAQSGREILDALSCGSERIILLGASTWSGEEELLLDIYRELRRDMPGLFLVLAPRHAERRAEVLALIAARGLRAATRQAMLKPESDIPSEPDLLLVDTTGELAGFYPHAALVFVGKSLCAHGGQNPIEPAACGRAVLVGPNMENFRIVMEDLLAAGAIVQVRDSDELKSQAERLLANPQERDELGRRAQDIVTAKRGAIARTVSFLNPLRGSGMPAAARTL